MDRAYLLVAKFNHDRFLHASKGELTSLYLEGWIENCPSEDGWSFWFKNLGHIFWPHNGNPQGF